MTTFGTRLGVGDVHAAARRIDDQVRHTPLLAVDTMPGLLVKAEHLQRGGSFKIRGAANTLLANPTDEVVAGSSGNHGIAVATLCAPQGIRVTVAMAAGASPAKAAVLRRLGATVELVPGGVTERDRWTREYAQLSGAALVPSSDHELVVAGQGTVGLEILRDAPRVGTVFVPTGGGGLLAGICLAAQGHPVRIVGVEPVSARRYALSRAAGEPVAVPICDSFADGLRAQRPGVVPLPIIDARVDDLICVTDEAVAAAMALLHSHGIAAEPSGAVAMAGALSVGFAGTAVVVVSGGNTPAALRRLGRQQL